MDVEDGAVNGPVEPFPQCRQGLLTPVRPGGFASRQPRLEERSMLRTELEPEATLQVVDFLVRQPGLKANPREAQTPHRLFDEITHA